MENLFKKDHTKCFWFQSERCMINYACDCCNYFENAIVCPNCERPIPNSSHLVPGGCKWCIKEK